MFNPNFNKFASIKNVVVPQITDTMDRSMRTQDLFSYLIKYRIVYLIGEINQEMSAVINASLIFLNAEDSNKEIFLYIHSPGGDVYSGLSIVDCMYNITAPVSTIGIFAASAGALILSAGDKIYTYKHSTIMLHQPHGGASGQATDLTIQVEEMNKKKEIVAQIIFQAIERRKKNQMSYRDFANKLERDWFLSSQEAFDLGLVDQILNSKY